MKWRWNIRDVTLQEGMCDFLTSGLFQRGSTGEILEVRSSRRLNPKISEIMLHNVPCKPIVYLRGGLVGFLCIFGLRSIEMTWRARKLDCIPAQRNLWTISEPTEHSFIRGGNLDVSGVSGKRRFQGLFSTEMILTLYFPDVCSCTSDITEQ